MKDIRTQLGEAVHLGGENMLRSDIGSLAIVSLILLIAGVVWMRFAMKAIKDDEEQDLSKWPLVLKHDDEVWRCCFSPDGMNLMTICCSEGLRLWSNDDAHIRIRDASTGELQRTLESDGQMCTCCFSSDSQSIASVNNGSSVVNIWNVTTGELLHSLDAEEAVMTVLFSPTQDTILTASEYGELRLWRGKTGERLLTIEDAHHICCFSPDGGIVLTADDNDEDSELKFWDAIDGRLLGTFEGHKGDIECCAFSPDGNMVISGSDDTTLKLWDSKTGKCKRTLRSHSGPVKFCAFSPNGKYALSSSEDNTVKIWDGKSGRLHRTLGVEIVVTDETENAFVPLCAFSPDSLSVLTTTEDGEIKIWDSKTGELQNILEGHTDTINHVQFSPDGNVIASASSDCTLRMWEHHTDTSVVLPSGGARLSNSTIRQRVGTFEV